MNTTHAVIDLKALQQNLQTLHTYAPESKILALLKANAYGHGMLKIAEKLQQMPRIYAFAVARLDEALILRDAAIDKPIVLLEGFFNASDLATVVAENLQSVVHSQEQVAAILNADLKQPLSIWLKLDTGMHRLGFHPEQFDTVYQQLKNCKNVQQPINLITHFNCADELDNPVTAEQIKLFQQHIKKDSGLNSLANSAATLAWPEAHYDMIRPGIALYGISPFADKSADALQLKAVMTLKSRLIAIREHKAGESVGYGATWTATEDTNLGVVAVGYGDGYPRMAPNGTPVLINGRPVPLVGRVSMDMLTVDLGRDYTDRVGDEVVLWGEGLPAAQVARHIGTIPYELVSKLTARVALQYYE
ncbi:MAG: alanine racemase [Psychromonas sp.]|nr:alanine racemase [Psychromonas sp.]